MVGRFAIESWGVQAAVEWDDARYDEAVRALLLPIWQDDPGLIPQAIFRLVTDERGEPIVESTIEDVYSNLRLDSLETLERRLHLYLATYTREVAYVHAGVVKWNGKVILLPGTSYAGKSTLVRALIAEGATLFSDEYAIIDKRGKVHPFPRPVCLREQGGVRRIEATDLGWDESLLPAEVSSVIVARFDETTTRWMPQEISPGAAVLELLSNTVSALAAPQVVLPCLARALEGGVICRKGSRGEAEEAAREILASLGTDSRPSL